MKTRKLIDFLSLTSLPYPEKQKKKHTQNLYHTPSIRRRQLNKNESIIVIQLFLPFSRWILKTFFLFEALLLKKKKKKKWEKKSFILKHTHLLLNDEIARKNFPFFSCICFNFIFYFLKHDKRKKNNNNII